MRVARAESAGFCLGVSLALQRLDAELAAFSRAGHDAGGRLITLGPIIHNPLVMRQYTDLGVVCESDPMAVRQGDRVVIRAHGIPRETEQTLKDSGAGIVDATCPKVKRAQLAIGKTTKNGGVLLLFGEKEHPEVRGLLSYACQGAQVFGDLEELAALPLSVEQPYFLAAQTTQERSIFQKAQEHLTARLGRDIRALDTICDATRDRQQEVLDLCEKVDAMVVVGGLNSGNTRRLAEVARNAGALAVHVEQVDDLTAEDLAGISSATTVGLTAGASTPQAHIDAMQSFLESLEPSRKQ